MTIDISAAQGVERVQALDWEQIASDLNTVGCAVLKQLRAGRQ